MGQELLAGKTLLIADDDADGVELMAVVLRIAGAEVRAAKNAQEALDALDESWRPDALIFDIGMPKVDGYELLQTIRKRDDLRQVPAVAVSAYAYEKDKQMAAAAGFAVHITKPYEATALIALLADLIAGRPPAAT